MSHLFLDPQACMQAVEKTLFFADGAARTGSPMNMFIMLGAAILFFYFIVLRPERKRRKKAEEQRGALKKGDRVVAMGIYGTVFRVEEKTIILKLYDGAKMEVLKQAISEVLPAEATTQEGTEAAPAEGKA